MLTKAEQTKEFILQTVAPIFNKNGYVATSLTDITKATGLTKGAIYGNFRNKEELAVATFAMTVKRMLRRITAHQSMSDSPLEKLLLITDFYRNYYDYTEEIGGCPILKMGVDTKHQNSVLFQYVQYTIDKIQKNIAKLIDEGIAQGEFRHSLDTKTYSQKIYTMIIGAIFMTHTMNDHTYLIQTMAQIETMVYKELQY